MHCYSYSEKSNANKNNEKTNYENKQRSWGTQQKIILIHANGKKRFSDHSFLDEFYFKRNFNSKKLKNLLEEKQHKIR